MAGRVPEGERPTAYRALAAQLRADIAEHRYPPGQPLPTESQLSALHGVSRQTVRRAFQDLVADGLVYRVPGRGTYAYDDDVRHLRSSGSIEDLLALALDTELEMLSPAAIAIDIEAASRLRLDTDEIVKLQFRRFHDGLPYCVTTAFLPVWLGRRLLDHPELLANSEQCRLRPFNGHHCQVPVTHRGRLTPEVKSYLAFVKKLLELWRRAPGNKDKTLFVCPEMGPSMPGGAGYNITGLPPAWPDAVVLRRELEKLWTR